MIRLYCVSLVTVLITIVILLLPNVLPRCQATSHSVLDYCDICLIWSHSSLQCVFINVIIYSRLGGARVYIVYCIKGILCLPLNAERIR